MHRQMTRHTQIHHLIGPGGVMDWFPGHDCASCRGWIPAFAGTTEVGDCGIPVSAIWGLSRSPACLDDRGPPSYKQHCATNMFRVEEDTMSSEKRRLIAHLMRRGGLRSYLRRAGPVGEARLRQDCGRPAGPAGHELDWGAHGEAVPPRAVGHDIRFREWRDLAVPHGDHEGAAGRESHALLAQHLRHRVPESRPRQGALEPDSTCSEGTGSAGSTISWWSSPRTRP